VNFPGKGKGRTHGRGREGGKRGGEKNSFVYLLLIWLEEKRRKEGGKKIKNGKEKGTSKLLTEKRCSPFFLFSLEAAQKKKRTGDVKRRGEDANALPSREEEKSSPEEGEFRPGGDVQSPFAFFMTEGKKREDGTGEKRKGGKRKGQFAFGPFGCFPY